MLIEVTWDYIITSRQRSSTQFFRLEVSSQTLRQGWNQQSFWLGHKGFLRHLSPCSDWRPLIKMKDWRSGVIRMGSPAWKWKSWKILRTKWAHQPSHGPFWMSRSLKAIVSLYSRVVSSPFSPWIGRKPFSNLEVTWKPKLHSVHVGVSKTSFASGVEEKPPFLGTLALYPWK